MRWIAIGAAAAIVFAVAGTAAAAGPRGAGGHGMAHAAHGGNWARWSGAHHHHVDRFAWRRHDRFWRGRYGWGAWGPVYGVGPDSSVPQTAAVFPVPEPDVSYRLPTKFDLPQVPGYHPVEVAPPQIFVINDQSHGRSGKPGGARVFRSRVAQAGEGFGSSWPGAPRIIELKAR
ncbi:hypothetical protein [Alsobacter soli]|uniref:hypothetical protein n=1 Tax=Alsobacter soli TaxID=2109933 RepID=UPI0011B2792E|nr:hypothetical protein [Alsobacter soli]